MTGPCYPYQPNQPATRVVEASPGAQSSEDRNELVAFDLDTGKQAWHTGHGGVRTAELTARGGNTS